jgi:outer membrane protein OmpA-like peptidoglycan-associated protein
MSTGSGACWPLTALAIVMATTPVFAQNERLMSKTPSECEIFSALSGDTACATEPSAGTQNVEGATQGLTITNDANQSPDESPSKTSKTSHIAAKESAKATNSGPKAAAFQSIQFEFNSAELTVSAQSTLDTVATVLQEPVFATSMFVIEGHTDSIGSAEFNELLSERRAQAVVHYLVQHGVPSEHLSARGMGESEPYDAAHPEAAVNRRVVVLNVSG